MSDVVTWIGSDGAGGALHTTLPNFRFEKSLEMVALLERHMATELFELIHEKDNANTAVEAEIEYGDDDDAVDLWRGKCSQVWLNALEIYDLISSQIGWAERAFSEENKTMMQEEIDRFQNLEKARARVNEAI